MYKCLLLIIMLSVFALQVSQQNPRGRRTAEYACEYRSLNLPCILFCGNIATISSVNCSGKIDHLRCEYEFLPGVASQWWPGAGLCRLSHLDGMLLGSCEWKLQYAIVGGA